jgi:hypothetical protein
LCKISFSSRGRKELFSKNQIISFFFKKNSYKFQYEKIVVQEKWGVFVSMAAPNVILFVSISAKSGICTFVGLNGTLLETKIPTWSFECSYFSFKKCPIETHDGSIAKFRHQLIRNGLQPGTVGNFRIAKIITFLSINSASAKAVYMSVGSAGEIQVSLTYPGCPFLSHCTFL